MREATDYALRLGPRGFPREPKTCEVGLNDHDCESPPTDDPHAEAVKTRCYRCGQRACRNCSTVRVTAYPRGRHIRICRDCQEIDSHRLADKESNDEQ